MQVDHKAGSELKPVHIIGPAANVERCKQLIEELTTGEHPAGAAPAGAEASRTLECPPSIVGRIIGRGGETIRSLQTASAAHILIDQVRAVLSLERDACQLFNAGLVSITAQMLVRNAVTFPKDSFAVVGSRMHQWLQMAMPVFML
jgi:hypothetical protein